MGAPFNSTWWPMLLAAEAAGTLAGGIPAAEYAGTAALAKIPAAKSKQEGETLRNRLPPVIGISNRGVPIHSRRVASISVFKVFTPR